jgi:hypothetical protein
MPAMGKVMCLAIISDKTFAHRPQQLMRKDFLGISSLWLSFPCTDKKMFANRPTSNHWSLVQNCRAMG